jgi:phenylpropionate dioxygenase-like ring-hydroxylating dioxygenase large terminal subunit
MTAEARSNARPKTPLEKAPEPAYGTDPIPKTRYTDPDFMRSEWERMWTRTWLLAARESDLAQPGAYATFEIGPESILIVRQADGGLLAHYNVCQHRGNRLVEPGFGNAPLFRCRFHGWVYGRDGALATLTDEDRFPDGLDRSRLCLRPVACDTWGGFVWVNLDPNAGPLREYLGILPEHLDAYHFDEQSIVGDVTLEVDCNWKTCVDAFNEAYHVHATHPDLMTYSDDVDVQIDCYPRHSRFIYKIGSVSPRLADSEALSESMRETIMRTHGVDPDDFQGTAHDVRAAVIRSMREKMGALQGIDFDDLHDSQLIDDLHYTIFPNVTLNIHARGFWLFRHRPHESDPNKMHFDFLNFVWLRGIDVPRPEHQQHASSAFRIADMTPGGDVLDEDMHNLPRIQAGMRSSAYQELTLAEHERRIRHFHDTLMGYIAP